MVKNFSSVKRMFSCPLSACHWRRCSALVRRISFKAGARRCPFERRCAFMCRSSLMRHDLIGSICSALGTWSSVSKSGFRRIRSCTVLIVASALTLFRHPDRALSFITPEFLITFNCPIDEIFNGFKSLKIWESDFLDFWRAITATWFSLKPHSMLTLRETWANCLGTSTWRVKSPKITNLWILPPHHLQLRTTWNLGQNLWQDYVYI